MTAGQGDDEERLESLYEDISRLNNQLVNAQRELSRRHAELARLNSIKDSFLAIAAHDLRTPLASTLAGIELLLGDDEGDPSTRRGWLEAMRDNMGFMLAMVGDLLDTAAMESGELRLAIGSGDLAAIARAGIADNEVLGARQGIRIEGQGLDEGCPAMLDSVRMRQAVNNVLSNAVKFSPPGGLVELSIHRSEAAVMLRVIDHGEGMDRELLERLFVPFQALKVRTERGERNTGLGLYISRKIMEAHGGSLAIESERGIGTRVDLSLPLS